MTYRAALGIIAMGLSSSAVGCSDASAWDGYGLSDNQIVFGIEQSKNAAGNLQTTVGYEFLDVRNQGSAPRGFVSDGRSCWAERLDDRLGQPRVEGGVAIFTGAALPDKGIAILANRPDELVLEAPAWTRGGDRLRFEAKGFAMPTIGPETLTVPSTDLAIRAPADAAAEIAIDPRQDLAIAWSAGEPDAPAAPGENVVASLVAAPPGTADARGVELRCFFPRDAGKGQFPSSILNRFAALASSGKGVIKGKLRIATHRQLTIFADGGWTVYVVASVDQRTQPFTLAPPIPEAH